MLATAAPRRNSAVSRHAIQKQIPISASAKNNIVCSPLGLRRCFSALVRSRSRVSRPSRAMADNPFRYPLLHSNQPIRRLASSEFGSQRAVNRRRFLREMPENRTFYSRERAFSLSFWHSDFNDWIILSSQEIDSTQIWKQRSGMEYARFAPQSVQNN